MNNEQCKEALFEVMARLNDLERENTTLLQMNSTLNAKCIEKDREVEKLREELGECQTELLKMKRSMEFVDQKDLKEFGLKS
jgi:predicted RNase H-like nuclease (RuvC/YqgF family)